MTLFDIVAGLLVLVLAIIGFARGAVREVVTLVSFTLAALAAVFLLPISHPVAHTLVKPGWASKVVAIAVVFVVAYIALRIAGASISTALHRQAALGALDRSLGFAFGAGRGLVALGLFCLVFGAVTPRFLQPSWIVGGPIYGVGQASGALIASLAPSGLKAVGGFGRIMKDQVSADSDGSSESMAPSGAGETSTGQTSAEPTADETPNSSDSPPYTSRRHRRRSPATLSVVNRPAE